MFFKIKLVEVILRRNTKGNPCNKNWRKDDIDILENLMAINKCRAPYQSWNTDPSKPG